MIRTLRTELMGLFPPNLFAHSKKPFPLMENANPRLQCDFSFSSAIQLSKQDPTRFSTPEQAVQYIQNSFPVQNIAHVSKVQFHLNFTFTDEFLAQRTEQLATAGELPRLQSTFAPRRVTIDFSSPNVAKEMHVGHLRSTLIGNSLALVHEFLGNEVCRVNHLGDWGAQFGMLLAQLDEDNDKDISNMSLKDLTQLYREAKLRNETDREFAARAKRAVVDLQRGDAARRATWQNLVSTSLQHFTRTYERLGLQVDYTTWFVGESFYQSHMESLLERASATSVQTSPTDLSIVSNNGVVLRKSDGSIGYDATDVAAVLHRSKFSDLVLYVVDAGQAQHFEKVFQFCRELLGEASRCELEHVKFGLVCRQGEGKIKTREGDSPGLVALLDDAKRETKSRLFGCSDELAEHVGTASVCFAELKTNRTQNYEFSLERICNPDGDSALYLFYALAKVQRVTPTTIAKQQRKLLLLVCKFYDVAEQVMVTNSPHHLCLYLLQLAQESSSAIDNAGIDSVTKQAVENVLVCGMRLVGLSQSKWSIEDREFLRLEKYRKRK